VVAPSQLQHGYFYTAQGVARIKAMDRFNGQKGKATEQRVLACSSYDESDTSLVNLWKEIRFLN
jgi:hypothetical protein